MEREKQGCGEEERKGQESKVSSATFRALDFILGDRDVDVFFSMSPHDQICILEYYL